MPAATEMSAAAPRMTATAAVLRERAGRHDGSHGESTEEQ
jgi:hypothetical protein